MSVALFIYSRQKLLLSEALSAFATVIGTDGATALLYSPRRCELATVAGKALEGSDGQPVDIRSVFEARVFCETAELRWLNDPGPERQHRAVILTEQDRAGMLDGWESEGERPRVIEKLPQTYLLWGEGTEKTEHANKPLAPGWSLLAMARVGGLPVPVPNIKKKANGEKGEFVLLHSVEYIVEAEHGNAVIFDERLVKLEVDRG